MGSKGPRANWRSVDQIAQGMSGIMSITGTDENSPTRVGIPLGDLVSGMWTAIGVQAALAQSEKTGQGQIVETSLLAGLVSLLCVQGQRYLSLGEVPVPIGNDHPVISPYGAFRAKDGLFNMDELHLTRLEPIDRIAALAPPLRKWKICCTPCTTTWPSADTRTRMVFITRHIKAETIR